MCAEATRTALVCANRRHRPFRGAAQHGFRRRSAEIPHDVTVRCWHIPYGVLVNTLEELAGKLDGVDPEGFLRTVREFNAACRVDTPFNPNVLDGRRTEGLAINKTNWANPLDTPPFHAYHVTTGVTFTFGGLKISQKGEVEDLYGRIIPGLYAAC